MSIYRRASGRYAVLIDLETSATGARRRKSIGTYRTRKEAEAAERHAIEARERGIDLSPKTVSVSELLDRYLADREALGRAPKTMQEYRSNADRLIRPHLGGIALSKLRPARIAEWVALLLKSGGEHGRPLKPKSVWHAFTLLNGALRFALRMELIGRNPCEAVTRPSIPPSEAKALAPAEITHLLEAARGTRWEAFVMLALATGARRGELCALTWKDVDFENGTLTIAHSLSQTRREGLVLKGTKNRATRTLPLSHMVQDALRRQRAMQAQDRLAAGSAYANAENALFTDEIGGRVRPSRATEAFRKLALRAAISTTRLHDSRHTAATVLITSGVDHRTASGVLGHASATVTLALYAHLMPEAQKEAVNLLGDRLERLAEKTL